MVQDLALSRQARGFKEVIRRITIPPGTPYKYNITKGEHMLEKLRPLGDRLLVQRTETAEEKTLGGIIIPDAAKEKAQQGKVIAVGQGKLTPEGKVIPMQVHKGDVVYFGKYAGTEAGENLLILREDEVLGILE